MPVSFSNTTVLPTGIITGNGSGIYDANVSQNITQTSHGFSVGSVLKFNVSAYALAKADTAADAEVVGIVSAVIDTNNFTLLVEGYLTWSLAGFTAGSTYFLSPTTAGSLTLTAPTTAGQVVLPLLVADSTTSGWFHKYRGEVLSGSPGTANANTVYAGPTSGSASAPGFRSLVSADLPATTTGYLVPSGTVIDFAGSTIPSGWLTCDGSAVSRSTYGSLFAALGTTWGAGDGSTTFNLPDLRGRVSIGTGTGSGLTARSLTQTGGEETHLLSVTEMPSHQHQNFATGDILASRNTGGSNATFASGGLVQITLPQFSGFTGGGTAHNNIQPFTVLNKIIKV